MVRGDIMNPVERPNTRRGMTPEESKTHRLLNDPIQFSQNVVRELQGTDLDGLLGYETPKQIEDLRHEFEHMLESAIQRHDTPAALEVSMRYTEFVTYALSEAWQYGIAVGAIVEQFRAGLIGIADLSQRGIIFGDKNAVEDLCELRRKHDLSASPTYAGTDLADYDKHQARERKRSEAA